MLYCPICGTMYKNDLLTPRTLDGHIRTFTNYSLHEINTDSNVELPKACLCPNFDCDGVLMDIDKTMMPLVTTLTTRYSIGVLSGSSGHLNADGDIIRPYIEIVAPDVWIDGDRNIFPKTQDLLKKHLTEFYITIVPPKNSSLIVMSTAEVIIPKCIIMISERVDPGFIKKDIISSQVELLEYNIRLISSVSELVKDFDLFRGGGN